MSEAPLNITELIMASDSALENRDHEDIDSDSDYEPPFMQTVTKEELRLARIEKRAQKKAEKHAKAEVFRRMGDELFSKEKYQEAYIPYLEALEIWPSNISYYIKLALTYSKLGWYEEAAHASTRALTLDPKSLEARYIRGFARLEQRLLRAAKADLEIVTTHDASNKRAEEALQTVLKALEAGTKLGNHTISLDTAPAPTESSDDATAPAEAVEAAYPELDFSYPHYDDQALEMDTLSNTSDCNHRGNGVPCRFYNRAGCAKGDLCPFSHAPDEKSVRDDLGRNVCIYFLLDTCKFGATKCVYSHNRFFLPKEHGWWNSPEETAKVKSIVELSEKTAKERRSYVSQLQVLERKARKEARKTAKESQVKDGKEAGEAKASAEEAGEKAESTPKEGEEAKQEGEKKRSNGARGKKPPYRKGGKNPKSKRPTKSENGTGKSENTGSKESASPASAGDKPAVEKKDEKTGLTTEYKRPNEEKRSEITPEPDVVLTY